MGQSSLEVNAPNLIPVQTRSDRPRSTVVTDFEAPSKLQEIWRYLPTDKLRGLDSEVMPELTNESVALELPIGWSAQWLPTTEAGVGIAGQPEDRIAAAAWTNAAQTLKLVAKGEIPAPARVSITHNGVASALHIVVEIEAHSVATMLLDHKGDGALAEVLEVVTGAGSDFNLVSVQDWQPGASHVSAHFMKPGRDSRLQQTVASIGGQLIRVTPSVIMDQPGAEVNLLGVYFAEAENYIEHRPFIDHIAERCVSNVTYKGALQGAGAHTVWVGDVLIRETAVGTKTYELNRNLLLTEGTRADSVPNLEIETGKIEGAGHASASGRFDDEQLFYLQARGLDAETAKRLVVRGFLNEVIQKIGIESVEERLMQVIETELGKQGI